MTKKRDYHGYMIGNSEKQIKAWEEQASKINSNPDYITAFVVLKSFSKIADQRLTNLEALAWDNEFKGVKEYSYKRAVRDARSWGGDRRFNTAPPTTVTEIEAKLRDVESFLSKKTSTKTGIISMYVTRANTMTERYGAKIGAEFTWQELANYFESESYKKGDMDKASKTMVRALATIKHVFTDEDLQNIKDINKRIERIDASGVVKARAKKLLQEGYTYDNLFAGK